MKRPSHKHLWLRAVVPNPPRAFPREVRRCRYCGYIQPLDPLYAERLSHERAADAERALQELSEAERVRLREARHARRAAAAADAAARAEAVRAAAPTWKPMPKALPAAAEPDWRGDHAADK